MLARDWIGWGGLSVAEQLAAIWGAILGLSAYLATRAMFGWIFAGLASRAAARRKTRRRPKTKPRRR